ncbi:exodeoxyribonuclease V subunit beta [Paraferrimonas haliotis]|uniref:RecBCD enzyme subunit RecB n=1 Tax=Paraferrimonas haliotis TaxID=2013866 RepID=A0AA37TSF2_9GAMM|nr:exodeoxyribonuclease V subunit beta [Paraferrimonas haliotis]GLS84615.1 RecBCD enzyme subunit RecB [Paraferrimonas haliotis]
MQRLNPLTLPLSGKALIEASAGTGKTYTIATLYLRFIIEQPLLKENGGVLLTPENILVVTFTRSATAELRDRIRARLHTAVNCFRGQGSQGDDALEHLYQLYQHDSAIVLKRLYAAEKSMDEAAIFTIHGFCRRALSQNAFSSGVSLADNYLENDTELLISACQDFWRDSLYPLAGEPWLKVMDAFKSGLKANNPETLANALKGLMPRKSLAVEPQPLAQPIEAVIERVQQETAQAFLQFRDDCAHCLDDVYQELAAIPKIQKGILSEHLSVVGGWFENQGQGDWPSKTKNYITGKVDKLEPDSQTQQLLAGYERYQAQRELSPQLYSEALHYVKQRLEEQKQLLDIQGPDDLMVALDNALSNDDSLSLKSDLIGQYPVALIDEFQDTDPLQYRVFNGIYDSDKVHCWLMIGDPKQAIYSFRGGDIETYSKAKQSLEQAQLYTLDKNYRSSNTMVAAVNQLFGCAGQATFLADNISYQAVAANDTGAMGNLVVDGKALASMNFTQFNAPYNEENYGSEHTAQTIAKLLTIANEGRGQLGNRALAPSDIAILVRDRTEAKDIVKALRRRNVRSVFLSRDSVFSAEIAPQLFRVLTAMASYQSRRKVFAALGTALMDVSSEDIQQFHQDELVWQTHQQRFEGYHELWKSKGVLSAYLQWLSDYQIAAKLFTDTLNGERQLADLNHIAELLQQQALQQDGINSLLNYFERQLSSKPQDVDNQRLRLESDKDLVQIVTIHASKGLEYPLVFLANGLSRKSAKLAVYSGETGTIVDFSNQATNLKKAEQQRLAEDVRLLYVALTRASYGCFINLTQTKKKPTGTSALAHVLGVTDDEHVNEAAQTLAQQHPELIACQLYEDEPATMFASSADKHASIEHRRLSHGVDQSWKITSYSGLSRNLHTPTSTLDKADDLVVEPAPETLVPEPFMQNRFSFPRGANPGTALHGIFEHQQFADNDPDELDNAVASQLSLYGIEDADSWQTVVSEWLTQTLNTPILLPDHNKEFSLAALSKGQWLSEMEFFIKVDAQVNDSQLNRLLESYPVLDADIAKHNRALKFDRFKGLIKGFIDLVFEFDGRYYVLDYKSNHLGNSLSDYHPQAMQNMMCEHRYDAQLIFYVLALHLYLSDRLPNYQYEQHMGGGVYCFLRGMDGITPQSGVFVAKPEQRLIESLGQQLGVQSEEVNHDNA